MDEHTQDILLKHGIGFLGVALSFTVALTPLRAVLLARRNNSLGGLDTRQWTWLLFSNMMWTMYALHLGDIWLFLSSLPPAILWLWFSLIGIRLLAIEEIENEDGLALSKVKPWEGGVLGHCVIIDELCREYRNKCITQLEMGSVCSISIALIASFACGPWHIPGVDDIEVRAAGSKTLVLQVLACFSSLLCFGQPITRLYGLIKRRNASTIFVPIVLASMCYNVVWGSYGFFHSNLAIIIPNSAGMSLNLAQICLKLAFSRQLEVSSCNSHEEAESNKALPNTRSSASARSMTSSVSMQQAHVEMVNDDVRPDLRRSVEHVDLLLSKLMEEGVYEDYLLWQQEYQKRREGSRQYKEQIQTQTLSLPTIHPIIIAGDDCSLFHGGEELFSSRDPDGFDFFSI